MGYYFLASIRRAQTALGDCARRLYPRTAIESYESPGAHFLSDVIFAGFFTYLVAWGLSMYCSLRKRIPRLRPLPASTAGDICFARCQRSADAWRSAWNIAAKAAAVENAAGLVHFEQPLDVADMISGDPRS